MVRKGETAGLEGTIDRFPKARILVIGDLMMDRFIWGRVSRISPEAPVPVVVVERETFLLGGAANVVHNIHTLGGEVLLCGVVGDDDMGRRVFQVLRKTGIETRGILVEPERQTTVKTRIFAHQQQVVRIDRETVDPLKAVTVRHLKDFLGKTIGACDGLILSDYGKGVLSKELIRAVIRMAHQTKRFVMVDPKLKNFFFYKGATVVTPNTTEAGAAVGIPVHDLGSLKRVGRLILKKLKCQVLVVTRGEEGMAIFEANQEPLVVPTVAREVYDVTGAGDTVIGTMALAMATGASVRDAAALGNYAAGIVVGKKGTATVTREELLRVMKENMKR